MKPERLPLTKDPIWSSQILSINRVMPKDVIDGTQLFIEFIQLSKNDLPEEVHFLFDKGITDRNPISEPMSFDSLNEKFIIRKETIKFAFGESVRIHTGIMRNGGFVRFSDGKCQNDTDVKIIPNFKMEFGFKVFQQKKATPC